MHQGEARRRLQGIIELANNRAGWLKPSTIEVSIDGGTAPTLVRTWALDPNTVVGLLENVGLMRVPQGRLFLPILPDDQLLTGGVEAELITTQGSVTVPLFRADQVLAAAGDYRPNNPELLDELLVDIDTETLDRCLQVRVRLPVDLQESDNTNLTSSRSLRSAVSCLGVANLHRLSSGELVLRLPPEVTAEWAVYDIEIEPPEAMASLVTHLGTVADQVLDPQVAARQIDRVERCIETARRTVTSLSELVPPTVPADGAGPAPQPVIEAILQGLRQLFEDVDRQLLLAHKRTRDFRASPAVPVADLLDVVEECARQLARVPEARIPMRVSAANVAALQPAPSFKVRQVRVPYTANVGELRQRRLGGPLSLAVMGAVLLVIAWRLWLIVPIGPMPDETERSAGFIASRDSIVTILLVFPALLATQLERRADHQVLADNSIRVATACTHVGLALPLFIAVLSVGDVRYNFVCGACAVAGLALLATAGWSYYYFVRTPTLARMRQRRVCREATS